MKTYTNPVYHDYMADPFVLHHEKRYYAYGTSPLLLDERVFPVLESTDLVHWELRGGALLPSVGDQFWAPEVAFYEGTFYMYYSAHGVEGRDHQLRVATSKSPLGPFLDVGTVLVPQEPFTIDAHPFCDAGGDWYLFYAQDFLTLDDEHRVGTGIVADRLVGMTKLAGEPHVVVRPHAEWQLFKAGRSMYGSVYDWYTVEGPSVLIHDNRYYCFYSGGAWENTNYGISYLVAEHPLGPYHHPAGSSQPIMASVPDKVIGPGHHCFTTSPDESEQVVVYHGWDPAMTARLMRVDRFQWEGDRPVMRGPTWTPQPSFS